MFLTSTLRTTSYGLRVTFPASRITRGPKYNIRAPTPLEPACLPGASHKHCGTSPTSHGLTVSRLLRAVPSHAKRGARHAPSHAKTCRDKGKILLGLYIRTFMRQHATLGETQVGVMEMRLRA